MPFGRGTTQRRWAATPPPSPSASAARDVAAAPDPVDPHAEQLVRWLDERPGSLTVLGICATGADDLVTTALLRLADLGRITAAFVEDDPVRAAVTSAALRRLPTTGLSVVYGDPGLSDTYVGRAPADLVLFGADLIDGDQVRRRGLCEALPSLLTARGYLAWWSGCGGNLDAWRHTIAASGLQSLACGPDWGFGRLVDRPRPLRDGVRLYPRGRGR